MQNPHIYIEIEVGRFVDVPRGFRRRALQNNQQAAKLCWSIFRGRGCEASEVIGQP